MTPAWHQADPDSLIRTLRESYSGKSSIQLDADAARAVWKRAASFRHTDPSIGHRISSALLDAVDHEGTVLVRAIAWTSVAESNNATGRIRNAVEAFERA